MKKVLFVSYNKHQKLFFNAIVKEAKNKNIIYEHLFVGKSIYKILKKIILISKVKINKNILDEICSYEKSTIISKQGKYSNVRVTIHENVAKRLYAYFLKLLKKKNIDMIIVWNGSRLVSAAGLAAAKELGVKTLYMENGYFPYTIVMDPKGVNAESSLFGKSSEEYLEIEVNSSRYQYFLENGIGKRALRKSNDESEEEKIVTEKEYIFIPFQVHDDTQIIFNSPYIKTMEKLLELVYENVSRYNDENGSDYWIAVKEHPSDHGRVDYSELFEMYKDKKIIFYKKANTDQLIKNSKLVVTVNSSVGLESLFRGKPVMSLGKAFYNIDGIVTNVKSEENFYEKLCVSLEERVNKELIAKFLYYLRFHYLVEAKKPAAKSEDVVHVIRRIEALI